MEQQYILLDSLSGRKSLSHRQICQGEEAGYFSLFTLDGGTTVGVGERGELPSGCPGRILDGSHPSRESDGILQEGKKQGLWTTSADTTEEVWYKQDIRHGKYELSDQNYTVTGYYKKGKKQGIWTTTYRDPRVEEQVTYRNDVKHGKYIHTASGSCRTGNYRQGLKEGTWIFFRVSADGQRTELYREIYVASQLTDRIPADREVGMKGPE